MRHLVAFCAISAVAVGCGGDFSAGKSLSGARDGGETNAAGGATHGSGGASAGGVSSAGGARNSGGVTSSGGSGGKTGCSPDAQCPVSAAPCRVCPDGTTACPWSKCQNGQCAYGINTCAAGSGGTSGTGGSMNTGGAGGGPTCTSLNDCNVPPVCKLCPNGTTSCETAACTNGHCVTSFPGCSGGSGGRMGAGGTTGMGGTAGAGGTAPCTSDTQCATGLKCCYPCGIQGCQNKCITPLVPGQCPLYP